VTTTLQEPPKAPRRRAPRRRSSRVVTLIGVLLILTGLGFLGYVGWQYYGTNIVAEQKQSAIKDKIEESWANNIDANAVGLLRVERFGADYEVPIVPTFSDEALCSGVGWDDKNVGPGQIGNFVIAGHRVTHGEPFRDFLNLEVGDRVEIETRTHLYVYELTTNGRDIRVDFSTSWPLFPVPDPDQRGATPTEELITLLTCSELFHTDDRQVALGRLVETTEKPAAQAADAATAPAE
jgi:sortase A